ncbi:MAG: hypothetical protein IJ638_02230, partial [Alphaproteobacteria bacterium]|nr:hypothetical protein [Alphaproteobacteria bacterium]
KSAIGSVAGYSAYIHFNRQNAPVTMYKGKLSGGQYDNITAYGGSASEGTEMPFLNYGSKYTKSRNVYAKTNLGYIHIYKLK